MQLWNRLRRRPGAILGGAIIVALALGAFIGPTVVPYDPRAISLDEANRPPSWRHPLGQDELGRDILSRIVCGARVSLWLGLGSVAIGAVVGTGLGLVSGYYGGLVDLALQRLIDIMLAFPGILLAILLVAMFGTGVEKAAIAVGIASIPSYTRLVRGSVLSAKGYEYVEAARSAGAKDLAIMVRHILPNCVGPLVVQSTLRVGTAILWAASLGFLGLAGDPSLPEWGAMLSRGRSFVWVAPHLVVFPGLAIMLAVLGFNLLGDGLRDALDPKTKI